MGKLLVLKERLRFLFSKEFYNGVLKLIFSRQTPACMLFEERRYLAFAIFENYFSLLLNLAIILLVNRKHIVRLDFITYSFNVSFLKRYVAS